MASGVSAPGSTLFDYVIVVAVKDGEPYVKWCFPPGREKDPLVGNIKQFCFPDLDQYPKSKLKAETFSFVLTESDGAKRWGYCRRTLEPGEGKRYPWCFCIVSFIPCFSIFSTLLSHVIQRGGFSTQSLNYSSILLDAVYRQPLPAPGGSFSVTVRSIVDAKPETFFFTRPDDSDSMFDYVDFEPLLHMLDAINIISVFTSLLVERRVIFIADELSTLSACVQAAVALLYPFSWQHVYIPVLPPSLLTFCCAPMPFVVGILRSSVAELNKLSDAMEEVAIVDIDRNKFLSDTSSNDYGLLPGNVAAPLLKAVAAACKTVRSKYSLKNRMAALKDKKARADVGGDGSGIAGGGGEKGSKMSPEESRNLANAFIAFFVDLVGNYRKYIFVSSRDPDTGQVQLKFDKPGFLDDQPPEARHFLELFIESQMFEVFFQERAKTQRVNTGRFEQRVTMYMQQGINLSDPCPGSDKKKAISRFTMYENGEISREDITKSVNRMLENEKKAIPSLATPPGSESFDTWSPSSVLMEGMLLKLGGHATKLKLISRGNWANRWCQLSPTEFVYFKNKGDPRPTGVIALTDIVSISFTAHNDLVKKSNCLELQTPGRSYYLVADTLEEGEKWAKTISRAYQTHSQSQPALLLTGSSPAVPTGGKRTPNGDTSPSASRPVVGRRITPMRPVPLSSSLTDAPNSAASPSAPTAAAASSGVQSSSDRTVPTRAHVPISAPKTVGSAPSTSSLLSSSPASSGANVPTTAAPGAARPGRSLPVRPMATYAMESPVKGSGSAILRMIDDSTINTSTTTSTTPGSRSPGQYASGSVSSRGPSPTVRNPVVINAAPAGSAPAGVKQLSSAGVGQTSLGNLTMRPVGQRANIQNARLQLKTNSDDLSSKTKNDLGLPQRNNLNGSSLPPAYASRELPAPPAGRGGTAAPKNPAGNESARSQPTKPVFGLPSKQAASSMPSLVGSSTTSSPAPQERAQTSPTPPGRAQGKKQKSSTLGRRTINPTLASGTSPASNTASGINKGLASESSRNQRKTIIETAGKSTSDRSILKSVQYFDSMASPSSTTSTARKPPGS